MAKRPEEKYQASVDSAVATELVRNAYTRERHYFLMRIIMGLSGYAVLSLIVIAILAHKPPEYKYFSTGCDGRIKDLVALNAPVGSMEDMTNWVSNAVAQAYTFDFQNYREEFMRSKDNFTPEGWSAFHQGMTTDSKLLQSVIDNQYISTAVENGTTVLVGQGVNDAGVYTWRFQMPLLVTYQRGAKNVSQNLMVTVVVERQNQLKNPRGIGIAQIIAQ